MKVRRIKWVTITVVQDGEDVYTMIGFGKHHHSIGEEVIEERTGVLMRVIYSKPIKVIE